ncbi:MAG: toprim domain-containing protein [Roseivirga sp.]
MATSLTSSLPSENPYAWIKQEISLPHFAITRLGWERDKAKSTQKTLVLKHPDHGKILVHTSPGHSSGQWYFYTTGAKLTRQGTLIDLLLKHQWSWEEIRALASNYVATTRDERLIASSSAVIQDPLQQTALARAQLQKINAVPSKGTYLLARGLEAATYQAYTQLKTNHYQAVFSLYKDFATHPRGRLCSTLAYYFSEGKSKKYFQKGLPRGLAMLLEPSPIERIVLTESPIDALSFKQLEARQLEAASTPQEAPKTLYLATCGMLSASIREDLQAIFKSAQGQAQPVVLAFDSDQAGAKMTDQTIDLLKAQGTAYEVATLPGEHKDWNEVLQQERALAATQEAQQHRGIETTEHLGQPLQAFASSPAVPEATPVAHQASLTFKKSG